MCAAGNGASPFMGAATAAAAAAAAEQHNIIQMYNMLCAIILRHSIKGMKVRKSKKYQPCSLTAKTFGIEKKVD